MRFRKRKKQLKSCMSEVTSRKDSVALGTMTAVHMADTVMTPPLLHSIGTSPSQFLRVGVV